MKSKTILWSLVNNQFFMKIMIYNHSSQEVKMFETGPFIVPVTSTTCTAVVHVDLQMLLYCAHAHACILVNFFKLRGNLNQKQTTGVIRLIFRSS